MGTATHLSLHSGTVRPTDDPTGALRDGADLVWSVLHDPAPEQVQQVGGALGLDPGLLTDARAEHRRPRLVEHGNARVVVLLPAAYDDAAEQVRVGGLTVLTAERVVLTVQRGCAPDLGPVRARLGRDAGPAALVEALVQAVVAGYDAVLDGLDDDVEQVEAAVFSADEHSHAQRIYGLKRETLELRRAAAPLVDVVASLGCTAGLQGRVLRVAEHVDRLDSLLDSILGADLAQVGVRQNEDQRRISAWAAIALVPTIVAGIYGMNFQHMPELSWRYGYPAAMGLVLVVCLSLYVGFRRNHWLGARASALADVPVVRRR